MKLWLLTDSGSSAEDSDYENEFEDCEDEQEQASAQQDESQVVTSGWESSTWGPPEGRDMNIYPFVGPAKCLKNSKAPHINKDSSPLSVLMLFFTQIFQLLVEQTNCTIGQTRRTQPPTARHYASGHDDFHCLGSADGT